MTINSESGVITWTPTSAQTGDQTFQVDLTDEAGNSRSQEFGVNVGESADAQITMTVTDVNGNSVSQLALGQEFLLNIHVRDNRFFASTNGVAGAWLDIFYDSGLAEPVGNQLVIIRRMRTQRSMTPPSHFPIVIRNYVKETHRRQD